MVCPSFLNLFRESRHELEKGRTFEGKFGVRNPRQLRAGEHGEILTQMITQMNE